MIAWNITRWRRIFKISVRAKNETQKSDFQLWVNHSRNVPECNCLETHIPRHGHTLWPSECDDYAFCQVCDDSFSVAHCGANVQLCCQSRSSRHESRTLHGIEQTVKTNSSIRQFFAAPSKTADSKAVSVTRAEVLLCDTVSWSWNKIFPLAVLSPDGDADDTLTKAMKLNLKDSNVSR